MTKQQQQQPAIPKFIRFEGEPEGISEYYERLAQERSALNQAKRGETLSLSAFYQEKRPLEQEQELQHEQEQRANTPAWALLRLPPNDPLLVEQRRRQLNHEQ